MPAQKRKRELAGEQFVISEARPRFALRFKVRRLHRPMNPAQCARKTRKILLLEPRRILPFGQIGNAMQRHIQRLAELVRMQSLGHRIDRIDQRQRREALRVHHALGMEHLQVPVVQGGDAGDVTQFALGQELLQIVLACVEISDGERVGIVARLDIVRRARPMPVDRRRNRHHRIGRDLRELRLVAPVDKAARQVEQQVDDARRLTLAAAQKPREYFFELRADAGQSRQRREQRIEHRRTHSVLMITSFRGATKWRARNP
jgi:hypothetical protein